MGSLACFKKFYTSSLGAFAGKWIDLTVGMVWQCRSSDPSERKEVKRRTLMKTRKMKMMRPFLWENKILQYLENQINQGTWAQSRNILSVVDMQNICWTKSQSPVGFPLWRELSMVKGRFERMDDLECIDTIDICCWTPTSDIHYVSQHSSNTVALKHYLFFLLPSFLGCDIHDTFGCGPLSVTVAFPFRLIGIPFSTCNNPAVRCYWEVATVPNWYLFLERHLYPWNYAKLMVRWWNSLMIPPGQRHREWWGWRHGRWWHGATTGGWCCQPTEPKHGTFGRWCSPFNWLIFLDSMFVFGGAYPSNWPDDSKTLASFGVFYFITLLNIFLIRVCCHEILGPPFLTPKEKVRWVSMCFLQGLLVCLTSKSE